jgi:hypothetical protein
VVRFSANHRFHGGPDAVAKVLSDPGFYVDLDLPDLDRPDLVEHSSVGDDVFVRLRYRYVGDLDPIVLRLLGHQPLSWIQEIRVDTRKSSGTLGYAAERNPKLLHGSASFILEAEGDETVRHLEGELVVQVIAIGGMAENAIMPGLLRRLDIEAVALDRRLGTGPTSGL